MQFKEDGSEHPGLFDKRAGHSGTRPLPMLAVLTGAVMLGAAGGWLINAGDEPTVPHVAAVSPEDVPQAIATLSPQAQQVAKSDSRGCRLPMGFITVATPGNPAGGTVSFRTSKYQSPQFHVSETPEQIAIPNPLPETGGVDLLSADGIAKGLRVSLSPTARMEPVNGTATVKVIWRPRPSCKE